MDRTQSKNLAEAYAHLELSKQKHDLVSKKSLINALNRLHFTGAPLWAHPQPSSQPSQGLVMVYPGHCQKNQVILRLPENSPVNLEALAIDYLVIEDGKSALIIPATIQSSDRTTFSIDIPEQAYRIMTRKVKRIGAGNVNCEIAQGNNHITGTLADFSVLGFRVVLDPAATNIEAFDTAKTIKISMRKDAVTLFEGICTILRMQTKGSRKSMVLAFPEQFAVQPQINSRGKNIRTPRLHLSPTPKASFEHPLSDKQTTFEIADITASGFSLHEHVDDTLLIPGLIVPHITLIFDNTIQIPCTAQVVHKYRQGDEVFVGFSIRDMDTNDFIQLCDILANALDPHASMSRLSDMDALWEIFFETGFVYPQKYEYISHFHDIFKETYRKLYQQNKDIFFFVTYQQNGKIFGHISIIRAYQRLWMMHHLTARPMHGRKRIGLEVLRHMFNIYDAAYRIPSNKLDYIMFYFRPTNGFMMFFQGNFCKAMNDPKICSMDLFAYHYLNVDPSPQALPETWTLKPFAPADLPVLQAFYQKASGGLFLDALGIGKIYPNEEPIEKVYADNGLLRRTRLYALKQAEAMKAFIIVDQSDSCINLSELLNCIKVIVLDPDLPWDTLKTALDHLAEVYQLPKIPVITYPEEYVKRNNIPRERSYYLWIHNSSHAAQYVSYMKKQIEANPLKLFIRSIQAKRCREND